MTGVLKGSAFGFAVLFAALVALVSYPTFFAQSFSLIAKPLTESSTFDAETIGYVSAVYIFASALVQIPAGIAYDRYRPGRILALAALICSLGAILIGISQTLTVATIGRLMMGVGAALTFLGSLKILTLISSERRFTLTTGGWQLTYRILVTVLVAIVAGLDFDAIWRHMMIAFGIVGIVLSVIAWICDGLIPEDVETVEQPEPIWQSLRGVLENRDVLLAGIFFGLTFGAMLSYAYLWAVPSLRTWGDSEVESVLIGGMVPIGFGIGAVLLGIMVDRWDRPRRSAALFVFVGLIAMTAMLTPFNMPQWMVYALAFFIGFGASASMLALSHVRVVVPPANIGTAIGVVTTMGYLFGTALQSGSGLLLEAVGSDGLSNIDFNEGLAPLIQCFALALLLLATFKPWPKRIAAQAP